MLLALRYPLSFVILLAAFLVAVTAHGWAQALVARRQGDRTVVQEGRTKPDPRRHVDPFGAVAVALGGLGWGRPLHEEVRRTKAQMAVLALVGTAAPTVLGAALLVVHRVAYGPTRLDDVPYLLQHGVPGTDSADELALVLGGLALLYLGLLNLVPLPPLDGGWLLLAYAPTTLGWQKARHQLVENNVGLVALLVLLLIPLGGSTPLLPALVDIVGNPLANALAGG